jgi:hypothetical protein
MRVKRTLGPLFVALLAILLMAGCGSVGGAPSPSARATATVPTRDPLTVVSPPAWATGTIDGPAPMATTVDNTSLPWTFVSLSADGQKVRVLYTKGDGECTTFTGFVVTETSSSVTLAATGNTNSQGACHSKLLVGAGTITLAAPLGQQDLMHAPVSWEWSNSVP